MMLYRSKMLFEKIIVGPTGNEALGISPDSTIPENTIALKDTVTGMIHFLGSQESFEMGFEEAITSEE